jgi:hypothetical protein
MGADLRVVIAVKGRMMGEIASVIDSKASSHMLTAGLKICEAELISPRAVVRL